MAKIILAACLTQSPRTTTSHCMSTHLRGYTAVNDCLFSLDFVWFLML